MVIPPSRNILDIYNMYNMYNMEMKPSSLGCARRGRHNFWQNELGKI